MIITLNEVKSILRITDNTYDQEIQDLIPLIEEDLVCYLNNAFPDRNTRYSAGTIQFSSTGDSITITDTQSQFIVEGFSDTMDIYISGTKRNEGIAHLKSVAAGTMITDNCDQIITEKTTDEYGGNVITLTRIRWPRGLKIYVSKIIWYHISKIKSSDVKSKSYGPASVTYESIEGGQYPKDILAGLAKYKNVILI